MPQTPVILEEADVLALLPKVNARAAMRQLFTELGLNQAVQPPQTLALLPEGRGDFITYLGASTGAQLFGAKLSPYLTGGRKPLITAWTMLMSMESGRPVLLCESSRLTTERTAATTALAVEHLARKEARHLAIIGAGKVAEAHLRHVAGLRDWAEIRVFAPSFVASLWQGLDPRVRAMQDAAQAIAGADVVMLCTSSGTPVIAEEGLAAGVLVTSISTNVAMAHEVEPALLLRAEVYCDHRQTTPAAAGEMQLASALGWEASMIRGDLAELSVGGCLPPSGEKPVFFRSVGLGLEDIFMAQAILAAHHAKQE